MRIKVKSLQDYKRHKITLFISKEHFEIIRKISSRLGVSFEDFIENSIQEYFLNYIIPIVENKR